MAQVESQKAEIQKRGSLVFIAAQKRGGTLANPEKFLAGTPSSFPYLLDEDRSVTKAYGVYKALGIDSVNIARPATFVIDASGKIRFVYVGAHQMDRCPMDKMLEALGDAQRVGAAHQT